MLTCFHPVSSLCNWWFPQRDTADSQTHVLTGDAGEGQVCILSRGDDCDRSSPTGSDGCTDVHDVEEIQRHVAGVRALRVYQDCVSSRSSECLVSMKPPLVPTLPNEASVVPSGLRIETELLLIVTPVICRLIC